MLIFRITTIVLAVIIPVSFKIAQRKRKLPPHELCIFASDGRLTSLFASNALGIILMGLSFIRVNVVLTYVMLVLGAGFVLCAMIELYNAILGFTALLGGEVIVKRLWGSKRIPLQKIEKIYCSSKGNTIEFCKKDKKGKCYNSLFSIDANEQDAAEFVHRIESRCPHLGNTDRCAYDRR